MLDKLNSFVQATRRWAKDLAYRVKNNLVWGYGHCVTEGDEELREYYVAIKKLRDQQLSTGICICNEELEKILWGAAKRLGPTCISSPELDYQRTESIDKALWVIQNPGCVAYETWAEQYQALCAQLSLDIKATQIKCADVGLDIFVAQKITCSRIELLLEVEKKACQVSADVLVRRMEACKVLVQTEVMPKVCDIDLTTAVRAVACGVDISTLVAVFACDVTLSPVVTVPDCEPTPAEPNVLLATCPALDCDELAGWGCGNIPGMQPGLLPNECSGLGFNICHEPPTLSLTNSPTVLYQVRCGACEYAGRIIYLSIGGDVTDLELSKYIETLADWANNNALAIVTENDYAAWLASPDYLGLIADGWVLPTFTPPTYACVFTETGMDGPLTTFAPNVYPVQEDIDGTLVPSEAPFLQAGTDIGCSNDPFYSNVYRVAVEIDLCGLQQTCYPWLPDVLC